MQVPDTTCSTTRKNTTKSANTTPHPQGTNRPYSIGHPDPTLRRPHLSDTIKRGTLSKNRKDCLDLTNIKAEGQPRGLGQFSDSPEARAAKASDEKPTLHLAEALPRKASDGLPILRFTRGPAHKASDEVPILRLARGRLGNNLVASISTDFSDKTSRPINTSNHSRNVSRTSAQHSRVADGTGDRTEQGLPAAVLSTAPITGTRTALCYLIPAPRTARRGESNPGHYSLGISV